MTDLGDKINEAKMVLVEGIIKSIKSNGDSLKGDDVLGYAQALDLIDVLYEDDCCCGCEDEDDFED